MTTPVDPGDTAAMESAYYQALRDWWSDRPLSESGHRSAQIAGLSAVARAVVPPGHHVIADDDLRILLNFAVDAGERAGIAGYAPMLTDAYDRLRAAIGDEG